MLSQVSIKNFQSLHDVTVDLSALTVIVGPSSSGKSAFTRALKTLTSNQRGDSFITHGESQCVIKAKTDKGTVALLRGKKNEYVLIPEDDAAQQKTFTKLAGNTPEEVSEFIGIPAKDPLNYSNQFDMPYLLTSSAGEVARTLGELTNVSVIFEASREANRRRLQASSTLKTRAGDYETLTQNLEAYKSLKDNEEKLTRSEDQLKQARDLETRIYRLTEILKSIKDIPEVKTVEVPDVSVVEAQWTSVERLKTILARYVRADDEFTDAEEYIEQYSRESQQADEAYTQELARLGTCPTCGADTTHVH